MTISERTLKNWRREALWEIKELDGWTNDAEFVDLRVTHCRRILQMTQILLDQHLLDKGK